MKGLLPVLFASAALAISAHAQNATTTPVGAMTYSFPATTTVTTTTMSIPLISTPVFTGRVGAITSNSVTVAGAIWTGGIFANPAQPYFVRFTSGNQAGRAMRVTANTSDTLTLDTSDNSTQTTPIDLSGWDVAAGANGDTMEILPGDTLATFFGDNTTENPLVFGGHPVISLADTVSLFNKSTGLWEPYFFHTTSGTWRKKGATASSNNVLLYPESSIMITRRNARPQTAITVVGNVPNVQPLTKITGSQASVFSSSRFPIDLTLSQLEPISWTSHAVISLADTISIYSQATGLWEVYFKHSTGQWRKKGSTVDRSSLSIPAGTAIGFTKRSALTGSSSFLKLPAMPYAL